jgi:hypothetical protein
MNNMDYLQKDLMIEIQSVRSKLQEIRKIEGYNNSLIYQYFLGIEEGYNRSLVQIKVLKNQSKITKEILI